MPKFLITDGVKYLRMSCGKTDFVFNAADATAFSGREKADRALEKGIPAWLRDVFIVEEIKEAPYDVTQLINANTDSFLKWRADITDIGALVASINTARKGLIEKLSETEDEILDIKHYIEFNRLNAHKGWEAYEMLRNTLLYRRRIKNALYILNGIPDHCSKTKAGGQIKRSIAALNDRRYKPRKLDFLFEDNDGGNGKDK